MIARIGSLPDPSALTALERGAVLVFTEATFPLEAGERQIVAAGVSGVAFQIERADIRI